MKIFKNILVSFVAFFFVFSPYFTLAQTLDTTLTPGDRSPQVSVLQKILNSIGQKVTEIGKETTYYGSLTSSAIKALQCKYNIVCEGSPETTGFGRVGPKTLALLNSLKNTFNVDPYSQVGAGLLFDDSLVAHYAFDGNTIDSKGGIGGTAFGSPTYTTGKIGQALQLDGVDDYVSVPDTSNLDFNGSQSFSISYWVKSTTATPHVAKKINASATVGYMISAVSNSGGIATLNLSDGVDEVNVSLASSPQVPLVNGEWHHVVMVLDQGVNTVRLYVDTATGNTANISTLDSLENSTPLYIGTSGKLSSSKTKGSIDDVRIYNKALSASEIGDLFSLGGGVAPVVTTPTTPTTPRAVLSGKYRNCAAGNVFVLRPADSPWR